MHRKDPSRNRPLRLSTLATVAAFLAVAAGASPRAARADEHQPPGHVVSHWLEHRAEPLATTEPSAPLADLRPLRRMVGDAVVVGLGASTHGAHQQAALKQRVVRFLVKKLGFRSLALEEDWANALRLNRYLLTGDGNLDALMAQLSTAWRTREMRATLVWLRAYNAEHPHDKVRFVGVDIFDTRAFVYDAVARYVERVAPRRLPRLRQHFAVIRPTRENHVGWFIKEVENKMRYVEHARAARRLVKNLPHAPVDRTYELALQHARQIVWFYEYFTYQESGFRDEKMAQSLRWWHRRTGDKIAYWAASVHTAEADRLVVSTPPRFVDVAWKATGAYLREFYGSRYVSIGFTFDHGVVNSNWEYPPFTPEQFPIPRPPPGFAERPLGEVDMDQYLLELRDTGPPPVRDWFYARTKTRVIGSHYEPEKAAEYYMTGGSLGEWFDVIIHTQRVTPSHPLP